MIKIKDCTGLKSIYGLMFHDMKNIDGALIYANSIWMPFVKFNLDLYFLDSEFRIIDIQHAVTLTLSPKTWKVYECKKAKHCLEVKEGLIKKKIGDVIDINSIR